MGDNYEWLSVIGFEKYIPRFEKHVVDIVAFTELTAEIMRTVMDIPLGDALNLGRYVKQFNEVLDKNYSSRVGITHKVLEKCLLKLVESFKANNGGYYGTDERYAKGENVEGEEEEEEEEEESDESEDESDDGRLDRTDIDISFNTDLGDPQQSHDTGAHDSDSDKADIDEANSYEADSDEASVNGDNEAQTEHETNGDIYGEEDEESESNRTNEANETEEADLDAENKANKADEVEEHAALEDDAQDEAEEMDEESEYDEESDEAEEEPEVGDAGDAGNETGELEEEEGEEVDMDEMSEESEWSDDGEYTEFSEWGENRNWRKTAQKVFMPIGSRIELALYAPGEFVVEQPQARLETVPGTIVVVDPATDVDNIYPSLERKRPSESKKAPTNSTAAKPQLDEERQETNDIGMEGETLPEDYDQAVQMMKGLRSFDFSAAQLEDDLRGNTEKGTGEFVGGGGPLVDAAIDQVIELLVQEWQAQESTNRQVASESVKLLRAFQTVQEILERYKNDIELEQHQIQVKREAVSRTIVLKPDGSLSKDAENRIRSHLGSHINNQCLFRLIMQVLEEVQNGESVPDLDLNSTESPEQNSTPCRAGTSQGTHDGKASTPIDVEDYDGSSIEYNKAPRYITRKITIATQPVNASLAAKGMLSTPIDLEQFGDESVKNTAGSSTTISRMSRPLLQTRDSGPSVISISSPTDSPPSPEPTVSPTNSEPNGDTVPISMVSTHPPAFTSSSSANENFCDPEQGSSKSRQSVENNDMEAAAGDETVLRKYESEHGKVIRAQMKESMMQIEKRFKRLDYKEVGSLVFTSPSARDNALLIYPGAEPSDNIFLDGRLSVALLDHQREGINFMWANVIVPQQFQHGCILAHGMGLGKSLQIVALIHTLWCYAGRNQVDKLTRYLLVVPASLTINWKNEFHKWLSLAGKLKHEIDRFVFVPDSARLKADAATWYGRGGVFVISYEKYRKLVSEKTPASSYTKEDCEWYLQDPGPDILICDEGHKLKNPDSQIYKAIKGVKTERRIILTGYPLQNSPYEYWAVINFVCKDFLGTHEDFKTRFSVFYATQFSSAEAEDSFRFAYHVLSNLLRPVVHRCSKEILAHPKIEYIIKASMTQVQQDLYRALSTKKKTSLEFFQDGVGIADHPDLVRRKVIEKLEEFKIPQAPWSQQDFDRIPEDFHWTERVFMPDYNMGISENSIKMKALMAIIERATELNEKTLVFSNRIPALEWISEHLQKTQYPLNQSSKWIKNRHFFVMHGKMSVSTRQEYIDQYNSPTHPSKVFLISMKAGGVGVNLVAATRVVIFDQDWNPSHERQAVHRSYRYGQTKPVFVYSFVGDDTVESLIHNTSVRKKALFNVVIDNKKPGAAAKVAESDGDHCIQWLNIFCEGKLEIVKDTNADLPFDPLSAQESAAAHSQYEVKSQKSSKRQALSTSTTTSTTKSRKCATNEDDGLTDGEQHSDRADDTESRSGASDDSDDEQIVKTKKSKRIRVL